MRMGLREANQKFAQAIRAVRAGQEVVLTDRGEPVAVIRRIATDNETARLEAMAASGLITAADIPGPMPRSRWRPEAVRGEPMSETVHRDRDETA
jgi:prevent-host-death family protein